MRQTFTPRRSFTPRRYLFTAALAVAIGSALLTNPSAQASDWMFQRSYFSHEIPPELADRYPVPQSQSAYRPAVASPYPGFGLQGVSRFNRTVIRSGQSYDYTLQRSINVRAFP